MIFGIWPKGRLNTKASTADLEEEREWQLDWRKQTSDTATKRHADENIAAIDRELSRRKKQTDGPVKEPSAYSTHEPSIENSAKLAKEAEGSPSGI